MLVKLCRRAFSTLMIVAVGMMNSIFETLSAQGLSAAVIAGWVLLAWLWLSIEAGVCEEFLFRGLLQSRLTAWIDSAPMAVIVTSVIFSLAHVPSFYLRDGEALTGQAVGLVQIAALCIGALAPISIMLGTLWHRTRSFLLVVLVHGAIDAMPAVERMMRIWG